MSTEADPASSVPVCSSPSCSRQRVSFHSWIQNHSLLAAPTASRQLCLPAPSCSQVIASPVTSPRQVRYDTTVYPPARPSLARSLTPCHFTPPQQYKHLFLLKTSFFYFRAVAWNFICWHQTFEGTTPRTEPNPSPTLTYNNGSYDSGDFNDKLLWKLIMTSRNNEGHESYIGSESMHNMQVKV